MTALLEVLQLLEYRRAGRHEIRLGQQFAQRLALQLLVVQGRQCLAHVQHAEHPVDVALIDDQLVVITGFQLMQDLFEGRVEVERFDPAARDHHVVDGNVLEIEQVQQNAAVLGRHEAA